MDISNIKVANNFSNAANNYDNYASLQKEVAAEVFANARQHINNSTKILDLGCGTGYLAKFINSYITDLPTIHQIDLAPNMVEEAAKIRNTKTLIADMELLPFGANQFDLIISSLAMQWANLANILEEIKEVMKPDAKIIFSTLGSNTFSKVKRNAPELHFKPLLDFNEISKICKNSAIPNLRISKQIVNQEYNSLNQFLKTIKNLGATENKKTSKYLGKDYFKTLEKKLIPTQIGPNTDKKLIISWEIILVQNF